MYGKLLIKKLKPKLPSKKYLMPSNIPLMHKELSDK
jgi:hypothetical protein